MMYYGMNVISTILSLILDFSKVLRQNGVMQTCTFKLPIYLHKVWILFLIPSPSAIQQAGVSCIMLVSVI